MPSAAIVDSAPLVALFDSDDQHHELVVDWFRQRRFSGHTTVAVLTEVSHMLRYKRKAQLDFLRWVHLGALEVVPLTSADLHRCIQIMEKYADLPADFADASLVAIGERRQMVTIVTLDRDFLVYRYGGRRKFRLPLLESAD